MNLSKTVFALAIGSVGIMGSMSAHAALGDLVNGDTLTISAGAQGTTAYGAANAFATGSWFAMDTASPTSLISFGEQVLLAPGSGITIGSFSAPGNYGATVGSATPVVATWSFNGNTGTNYFNSAIGSAPTGSSGGTVGAVNMSAWDVAWATTPSFNMGGGSWNVTNPAQLGMADINGATAGSGVYGNGTAVFAWDGVYGSTYTLDYTATVPSGSFLGTQYAMHLTGTVQPVPEASTYGMMLAGLGLVGFAVRRRKLI